MIPDLEVYRGAKLVLDQHGANGELWSCPGLIGGSDCGSQRAGSH
jgi:hypothetical protein